MTTSIPNPTLTSPVQTANPSKVNKKTEKPIAPTTSKQTSLLADSTSINQYFTLGEVKTETTEKNNPFQKFSVEVKDHPKYKSMTFHLDTATQSLSQKEMQTIAMNIIRSKDYEGAYGNELFNKRQNLLFQGLNGITAPDISQTDAQLKELQEKGVRQIILKDKKAENTILFEEIVIPNTDKVAKQELGTEIVKLREALAKESGNTNFLLIDEMLKKVNEGDYEVIFKSSENKFKIVIESPSGNSLEIPLYPDAFNKIAEKLSNNSVIKQMKEI